MAHSISRRALLLSGAAALTAAAACAETGQPDSGGADRFAGTSWRKLTDDEWRKRLSPEAYVVLRQEATERPHTSALDDEHRDGVFACAGCGLELFQSAWKFDSGTGWPSFHTAIDANIGTKIDRTVGMVRVEYHCARCLGHQGHRFNDGPAPTGLRYCNNGIALAFTPT